MNKEEMLEVLIKDLGYPGRMISGSKSFYTDHHPNNFVIFNANIIVKEFGKIWHGDLDITVDGPGIKEIAKKIGTVIYILREMHCRFDTEKDPIDKLIERAAWHTDKKKCEAEKE